MAGIDDYISKLEQEVNDDPTNQEKRARLNKAKAARAQKAKGNSPPPRQEGSTPKTTNMKSNFLTDPKVLISAAIVGGIIFVNMTFPAALHDPVGALMDQIDRIKGGGRSAQAPIGQPPYGIPGFPRDYQGGGPGVPPPDRGGYPAYEPRGGGRDDSDFGHSSDPRIYDIPKDRLGGSSWGQREHPRAYVHIRGNRWQFCDEKRAPGQPNDTCSPWQNGPPPTQGGGRR